jgi:CheY-like chemotaxis protein
VPTEIRGKTADLAVPGVAARNFPQRWAESRSRQLACSVERGREITPSRCGFAEGAARISRKVRKPWAQMAQFLKLQQGGTPWKPFEMMEFHQTDVTKPAAARVLVVDDEPLIRWSISETLAEGGYDVVEEGDAKGARLAVGTAQPFDVVLLDYRLPDSDDLSLLASIRKVSPAAQVILMTAFGRPEVVRGALDLGAYRVISKPFEMEAIADLVRQARMARVGADAN